VLADAVNVSFWMEPQYGFCQLTLGSHNPTTTSSRKVVTTSALYTAWCKSLYAADAATAYGIAVGDTGPLPRYSSGDLSFSDAALLAVSEPDLVGTAAASAGVSLPIDLSYDQKATDKATAISVRAWDAMNHAFAAGYETTGISQPVAAAFPLEAEGLPVVQLGQMEVQVPRMALQFKASGHSIARPVATATCRVERAGMP
jgi:hypothetical protein